MSANYTVYSTVVSFVSKTMENPLQKKTTCTIGLWKLGCFTSHQRPLRFVCKAPFQPGLRHPNTPLFLFHTSETWWNSQQENHGKSQHQVKIVWISKDWSGNTGLRWFKKGCIYRLFVGSVYYFETCLDRTHHHVTSNGQIVFFVFRGVSVNPDALPEYLEKHQTTHRL